MSIFCEHVIHGSNTDSGSKIGVQYRDNSILYLAFIVENILLLLQLN